MPNWCDGDVTIYGSREDLEALVAQASKGTHEVFEDWDNETRKYKKVSEQPNKFSFENFYPTPEGDSIGWRVENWGTKWDLSQDIVSITEVAPNNDPTKSFECEFGLGFQTAWSPAFGVFEKISEQYPKVFIEYRYIEESMSFFGISTFEEGEIFEDTREITAEDLKIAGCVMKSDDEVDWDETDEYNLYLALDAWKEYDLEKEGVEV